MAGMDPFGTHGKSVSSTLPEGRFVSIGSDTKQVPQVEGILLGIEESGKYPGNKVYCFGTKEEILKVGGNKFLDDKVVEVGALYKIEYVGKARSKKGFGYKTFDVFTVDAATVVKEGYDTLYKSSGELDGAAAEGGDGDEGDDDNLPF